MENPKSSNNKSNNRKGKISKFTTILAGALFLMNPSGANAQNISISNQAKTKAEVSTSTILDRLSQKVGVSLPDEYNNKVLDFVLNDTIMRTRSATDYTEEFIINEMKKDRGINKQNQLLFIWSKIYGGISQKKLYNRLDDENEIRYSEYKKSLKQIATCYDKYKKGFRTYMEMGISEADRRISEANDNAIESLNRALNAIIDFYNSYNISPDSKRFESFKPKVKQLISRCKTRNIDYRATLLKEVGDEKKVDEILKFYGVE